MGLQNHEKFIQDKMKNYQMNLEGDDLWKDLEAFVPQEEKRRNPLFILLIGALIGLFVGLFLFSSDYFINKKDTTTIATLEDQHTPESISLMDTDSNTNYNLIKDEKSALNTHSMDIAAHKSNTSVKVSKNPLNTIFSDESVTNIIPMNSTLREKTETSNSIIKHQPNITSSTISNSYVNDLMQDVLSNPISTADEKKSSFEEEFSSVVEKDSKSSEQASEQHLLDIGLIHSQALSLVVMEDESRDQKYAIVQCPFEKMSRWNLYVMSSTNYVRSNFVSELDNNYKNLYDKSHTAKISWGAELGINYHMMPNWGFTVGAAVNNMTSQIKYQYHTLEKEAKGTDKILLITSNGTKVETNEDVSIVTKKTYDGTWYNHRMQTGLKTGIFYEFKLPYTFTLNCQLGIYTNVYSKQYGHFLTDEFSIEQASVPMNNGFQFNLNPYTSLGLHYTWNNGLKTGININYVTLKSKYNNKIIRDHIYNIGLVCRYPIN